MTAKRVYIAGHNGMVGSAVCRRFAQCWPEAQLILRSRQELNLCEQHSVREFFAKERPDTVVFCAAKVGGIHANSSYPAEFGYQNLLMAANAIHAAYENGVERFLFLGSTCIYPRDAEQPLKETALLTSPLEQTNEAYALAKIAGLKLCQYYREQYGVLFHSAMPTNLYGPGDNYHPENSHVLPALLRKFHEAKIKDAPTVTIWGTGKPRREFLHVDDLAEAIQHLLTLNDPPHWINVGTGEDIAIADLAELVADVVGYSGRILNDVSKPDGTPIKRTDMAPLHSLGWKARIGLREGIEMTYESFQESIS